MVSGSLSVDRRSEQNVRSSFLTYSEQFYEVFPYYLAIGMTYEQFWDGDPTLVKYYRKSAEIKRDMTNQELWLQGLYVYEALCNVSPLLHAFARKGAKAHPYPSQPYAVSEKQRKIDEEERERKVAERGMMLMEKLMKESNKKFKGTSQST